MILSQAALAASSRWLLPKSGADPRHPSQLCTSQDNHLELHGRDPMQWVLGTQHQPAPGLCLGGWGKHLPGPLS